jgi:hypothetical protein
MTGGLQDTAIATATAMSTTSSTTSRSNDRTIDRSNNNKIRFGDATLKIFVAMYVLYKISTTTINMYPAAQQRRAESERRHKE